MEVAMPMAGSAIDCYEDMFKEITRKLYGEDGLPDISTTERMPSTGTDRGLTPIDYEVDTPILKPEEHLTAFGLAALMQNGFPATGILNTTFPTHKATMGLALNVSPQLEDKWITSDESLQWTQSKVATYNPSQKLFRCSDCESVGYLNRVAEHWLGTHSNLRAFHCPQCSYESAWARCVRIHLGRQHNINIDESCDALTKDNPVLQDITKFLHRLKTRLDNGGATNKVPSNTNHQNNTAEEFPNNAASSSVQSSLSQSSNISNNNESTLTSNKRYSCTYCPYATDRRDLFTRHENIHREEKPFQCYVCQKQFNRADHVKKHFLRMHRDHPYDLNRIRRHPPKNASGMSYYQKYNSTSSTVQQEAINTLSTISALAIPGFNGLARNASGSSIRQSDVKSNKPSTITSKSGKKKGEKRFTCCYCSWSGVDNWCLKRHMNTHLKPFVCGLCDYKAARSERLATHVLKVHNKRACAKCSFLADDLAQLTTHQQEQHPLESRNRALGGMSSTNSGSSNAGILRTGGFNGEGSTATATLTSGNSNNSSSSSNQTVASQAQTILKNSDLSAAAAQILQHNRFLQNEVKSWKGQSQKQIGAARLFSYMEASDGSDTETEPPPRNIAEDVSSRVNLTHRIQSDFLEAGGVEANYPEAEEETGLEETELPLFVCQTCGCEFEDDLSLETHQFTHRHVATSPAKNDAKENVDPYRKYSCKLCDATFDNQSNIISHMTVHTNLTVKPVVLPTPLSYCKRSRKQSKPKKVVIPYWDSDEVEVLRHLNGKLRKWKGFLSSEISATASKLVDKYMAQLVTRKGLTCKLCKKSNGISRYHTKASLLLHHYWKHSRKRFSCEHCNMTFRHRYQTILHSSRVHSEIHYPVTPTVPSYSNKINVISNLTVALPQIKDTTHISLENVSANDLNSFTNFFNASQSVAVPDGNMSNAHKLGMSFFDHSFVQNNVVNNHMPIIIPTFQSN